MAGVEALAVIIARDLDDIGTALCIFPRHVVGTERWDAVARRVVRGDLGQQHPHCVRALGTRVGVVDLVADAPEQQAWMVAVAADPGSNILFLPLVKEAAVVVGFLPLRQQPKLSTSIKMPISSARSMNCGAGGV